MTNLYKFLRGIHPLSEACRDRLEDGLEFKRIRRKDHLLRAGQICSNIYFVESGLLLNYYVKVGKTISSSFSSEGQICTSIRSFFDQDYGIDNIQALEDSAVYYLSKDQYQSLCNQFHEFNTICRILLEKCIRDREERLAAMWMLPADRRWEWLVRVQPDLLQRVAAKHLSSYVGVTESMFSMIRKNEL